MKRKFVFLWIFATGLALQINQKKTMFMVINGITNNKLTFKCDGMNFYNCPKYIYLASVFIEDGMVAKVLKEHYRAK